MKVGVIFEQKTLELVHTKNELILEGLTGSFNIF